jgi:hypothetical protein
LGENCHNKFGWGCRSWEVSTWRWRCPCKDTWHFGWLALVRGRPSATRRMGSPALARDRPECHMAQGLDTATPKPELGVDPPTPSWAIRHPRPTPG